MQRTVEVEREGAGESDVERGWGAGHCGLVNGDVG